MKKQTVKFPKGQNVYFDGEYLCTFHWVIKARYFNLDKELTGLVSSGVPFCGLYQNQTKTLKMLFGDAAIAETPNIKNVIPSVVPVEKKVERTQICFGEEDEDKLRIYKNHNHISVCNDKYSAMLSVGEIRQEDGKHPFVCYLPGDEGSADETVALVMPVKPDVIPVDEMKELCDIVYVG